MGFLGFEDEDEYYAYMGCSPIIDKNINYSKKVQTGALIAKTRLNLDTLGYIDMYRVGGHKIFQNWSKYSHFIKEPPPEIHIRGVGIDLSSPDKVKALLGIDKDIELVNINICKPNEKYYTLFKLQEKIGLDVTERIATIEGVDYRITNLSFDKTNYTTTTTLKSDESNIIKQYTVKIPRGTNWYFIQYYCTDDDILKYAFLNADDEDVSKLYTTKSYDITDLEAMPVFIIKHNKTNITNAENGDRNVLMTQSRFEGTQSLFKKMKLPLEDIIKGVEDANDKGEFTDAFVLLAARPKDVNRGTSRYLYNFFNHMYQIIPITSEYNEISINIKTCVPEYSKIVTDYNPNDFVEYIEAQYVNNYRPARQTHITWKPRPILYYKGKVKNGITHKAITEKWVTHREIHYKITRRDDKPTQWGNELRYKFNVEKHTEIVTILDTGTGSKVEISRKKSGTTKKYNINWYGQKEYSYNFSGVYYGNNYRDYIGTRQQILNEKGTGKYLVYDRYTYSDKYPKGSGLWKTWEVAYWDPNYDKFVYNTTGKTYDDNGNQHEVTTTHTVEAEGIRENPNYDGEGSPYIHGKGDGSFYTKTTTSTSLYIYRQVDKNTVELMVINELNSSVTVFKPDGAWSLGHNAKDKDCLIPIFKKFINTMSPIDKVGLFEKTLFLEIHAYHHEEIEWFESEAWLSITSPIRFVVTIIAMVLTCITLQIELTAGLIMFMVASSIALTAAFDGISKLSDPTQKAALTALATIASLGLGYVAGVSQGINMALSFELAFKIACDIVSMIADIVANLAYDPKKIQEELKDLQQKTEEVQKEIDKCKDQLAEFDNTDPATYWNFSIQESANMASPISYDAFMYIATGLTTDVDYYIGNFVKDTVTDYVPSKLNLIFN